MSSDSSDGGPPQVDGATSSSVEYLLFDSLVHHLIEKGLLTKNDALSVVQTAAEVMRGRAPDSEIASRTIDAAVAALERTYSSFEALPERYGRSALDARNVHPLRMPLHADQPRFPSDEDG